MEKFLNKLIQGDCLEMMKELPDNSVDMVFADLPFGTTQCKWDVLIPFKPLWIECKRIIKPNKTLLFHAAQPFTSQLILSNLDMYKYSWVWEKSKATGFLNSKIRPLVAHEDLVVFSEGKPPYFPQMREGGSYNKGVRKAQTDGDIYGKYGQKEVKSTGGRYPRSVVYFKTAESEGKTYHKTQKPVALAEYFIKTYTTEGDIILDMVAGSGTVGKACQNTGRNFILIEKEPEYCDIIRNRLFNQI